MTRTSGAARRPQPRRPEQPLAESSTADPPHVQLDELAVVRRLAMEKLRRAALQQHVSIAGMKRRRSTAGSRNHSCITSARAPQARNPARQRLDLDICDAGDEARAHVRSSWRAPGTAGCAHCASSAVMPSGGPLGSGSRGQQACADEPQWRTCNCAAG